jgi:SagB-type dehydrogenase family enzyme
LRPGYGVSAPLGTHVAVARAKLRRARHLVLYWRESRLVVHNYATGRQVRVAPPLCQLLDCCSEWRTLDEIAATLDVPAKLLTPVIRRLVARSLLERSDRREDARTRAMGTLDRWNPEAGFFHTATKDVRFWTAREAARAARAQARRSPMPEPVKRYRGAETVNLPRPAKGPFAEVLVARRTWRRFSGRPLSLDDLGTLLGLSAGVQQWARSGVAELALKTSPSGGARHPIECYVVASAVQGLPAGIYHYSADRHSLERLRGPLPVKRLASYYPSSGYFAKAPAHVFLTAVFARQLWRYPYSRAYRAALAEAGHVCQTFCLTATSLGLAPFCLMGLADSLIERDLGVDGITESVLYAAGVGHRPKGSSWAPLARGTLKTRRNPRM